MPDRPSSDISSPEIFWRADGSPQSRSFEDIYFSADDGLEETRHVFLQGNRLPSAWAERTQFTIAETGFGTGLNFLATWALWHETRAPGQRLNYVSVEGFPLTAQDLARALKQWPQMEPLAEVLIERYPTPHRGVHVLSFPDNVTLTLLEDEVLVAFKSLDAQIDAWFLDGFSPATNPDMWSEELFEEIARLSGPGTTFATYTVAGAVRRGLSAVGFSVAKEPGFGRKRDMLTGILEGKEDRPSARPWYQIPTPGRHRTACIVGAGIAGASTAAALTRAGVSVTLIDSEGPGAGASGNPAALFMPRMASDGSAEGRFHIAAYLHMEHWLSQLPNEIRNDVFRPCGVLQLARTDADTRRFDSLAAGSLLPQGHMELVSAEALSALTGFETGLPALLFPKGGVLTPRALLRHLIGDLPVHRARVHSLMRHDDLWSLHAPDGSLIAEADMVVLANGTGLTAYPQTDWLPLEPVRGQITELPEGALPPQQHALVAGPYLISHADGSALTGATYDPGASPQAPLTPSPTEHQRNLDALAEAIPPLQSSLDDLTPSELSGRVAFRAQVPDRVPFAGPAPDQPAYLEAYDRLRHGDRFAAYPPAPCHPGLFLFGGLGARGFATALLLGEHLTAQAIGAPLPLPHALAETVHPARFIIRALRKNIS
ncbi:MAG: bifunctional tRNA (5-methylaminomethyl-2-thiouridine)(34)-methyltransferase MnmD/FAD-dependent 5-carboxymethylaminomethyl-2-thiouridine(34) oxidoreductase MnmC [Rhodobiaceae bacterium]|nr:MAG: bifunctional tRNA (5-methylaminomethyl-2-thiouridine)(34)-methyltransferase MnmD/FAD-dependent 5-carboxymethylaminomethyl-2-thiouridine(34) oxidoreductase MnmC [Rhodobiaceae bacterium]